MPTAYATCGQGRACNLQDGPLRDAAFGQQFKAGAQGLLLHRAQQTDLHVYFRDARHIMTARLFAHNAHNARGKRRFMHRQRSVQDTQGSMLLVISAASATVAPSIITPRAFQFI